MKLIFITRESHNLAGARIRCYNFAKELVKYSIKTEVLSFADDLGAMDGECESQMKMRDKIRFNWKAFNKLSKEKDSIFLIQRFNYHSFAPYLVHLFKNNRIILDLDDWEMKEDPRYYFYIYPSSKAYYFVYKIAKRSIFCIAASRFLEKFLLKINKKTHYIPSGVDTELFKPSLNGGNDKKIVFSWIGTFNKKEYIENIKFALDCFNTLQRRYHNIYFHILGNGIYRDELCRMVKNFKNYNIIINEWLRPEEIPNYLDDIRIGLLPVVENTKFNLSKSPTKLFEYMAMAKPTVCSNIGEARHIIDDGKNGFLAGAKEEFVKKMELLIKDRELRKRMGTNARKTVEKKYSLEVLGKHLYEIISQIYA